MEMRARRSIYMEQMSVRSPKACELDLKKREQAVTHQPVPGQREREILCPQPRRAVRIPYAADSLERLCCTLRGESPTPRKDASLDILSLFFCKDRSEDDLDTDNGSQIGFFCGSPPIRADNPLVHDVQFVRQTSTLSSPLGNSFGAKGSSARAERAPSCGKSSFGGKPVVRVEGFSCGGSKSNCIVSARA
ncbi:hypothetical protein MKW94_003493 [Papaver nudicaule]|uniref:Uncharacterized protein n=1 Tax=Papaver nudicaule TaxID=74823 RepID=A0AA41VHS4_PAPNU|nr:hypothetical protein [Papaver nudicaule]MCL7048301.1 hypothetical protein [Papaver nudicaule]